MNDELFKVLSTILGTIITVGVGYIVTKVGKVETSQHLQAIQIAEVKGSVSGLQSSVNRLHDWRNKMQEQEFKDMVEQIAALKNKLGED